MAEFVYNVKYRGEAIGFGMAQRLVDEVEEAREEGRLNLRNSRHAEFFAAYRFNENDSVSLGIRTFPAKIEGAEQLFIHFGGREEEILKAKSKLLEVIKNLEIN